MQRDKKTVPWMQYDIIWERGVWALIEKSQLITQKFDKTVTRVTYNPSTDNGGGGSVGARGALPQLGPGTACSLPCAFPPHSHARAGGFCPGWAPGAHGSPPLAGFSSQTTATILGLGVLYYRGLAPRMGLPLLSGPLFMVNQYVRED